MYVLPRDVSKGPNELTSHEELNSQSATVNKTSSHTNLFQTAGRIQNVPLVKSISKDTSVTEIAGP